MSLGRSFGGVGELALIKIIDILFQIFCDGCIGRKREVWYRLRNEVFVEYNRCDISSYNIVVM